MTDHRQQIDAEFEGILPYHEVFYLSAIRNAAAQSIEHFNRFINLEIREKTHDAACYEFFSAVLQAANVSVILWPNPKHKAGRHRGLRLRSCFDPLAIEQIRDRKLRNRVSHMDEYIDEFCASDASGEIIDGFIGDADRCREPYQRVLRMVDPIKQVAVLFGYEFAYRNYFESIGIIGQEAEKMFREGGRLPPSNEP